MLLFHRVPLALTTYGWSGVVALLVGLLLTYKIGQRRVQSGKESLGCLGFGYVFLVVSILMVFAIGSAIGVGSSIYKSTQLLLHGQRYPAKVISYTTYESHDSDAGTTTTMFTPTLEFTTASGQLVEHTVSYSSSSKPTIGEFVTVYYDEVTQKGMSFGFGALALFVGALIFMVTLVFVFWGVLLYAMNYDMTNYFHRAKFIGVTFFIPLLMILFDGLLIYALFYGNKVPFFVTALLVFFILVLSLAIWGYIKMIFTHDIAWEQTGPNSWGGHPVPKKKKKEIGGWMKRN